MGRTVSDGAGLFRVVGDGHYTVTFAEHGIEFSVDRLRRERHDLHGELSVACGLVGAKTIDGVLSVGTFNLSSPSAAQQRAKLLAERARARGVDWAAMLEELRQRGLTAERTGDPAVLLRTVARPPADEEFDVLGMRFPRTHPAIVFGDGGTMKSYLALQVACALMVMNERVLYADWELDQYTHRHRLEQIAGQDMPDVRYVRCDRPLVHEVDRLRRIIQREQITYLVCDSIGYGTMGAPESAEAAIDYCRAVRQLGLGTLLIAHITKAETGDQRPFGSVFWHNSARGTWNLKAASTSSDGRTVNLAAFNRKSNLGPVRPALGLRVQFDGDRVYFDRVDVATLDEVAESLPLWQRIRTAVTAGPLTLAAIASELKTDKVDSLDRVVRRHKNLFTKITGSDGVHRIALLERRAS